MINTETVTEPREKPVSITCDKCGLVEAINSHNFLEVFWLYEPEANLWMECHLCPTCTTNVLGKYLREEVD